MIKNNRPFSIENGYEDGKLITDEPYYTVESVMRWIRDNIFPAMTAYHSTSYGIKHELEHDTGIYLTNNQFKDAMLLMGYRPINENELNWVYNITLIKRLWWNPSPFVQYAIARCSGDDPEGDFARDIMSDLDFPKVADYGTIRAYLESNNVCSGAMDAFENMWEDFEMEGLSIVPTAPVAITGARV